jgi:hypothetical protein
MRQPTAKESPIDFATARAKVAEHLASKESLQRNPALSGYRAEIQDNLTYEHEAFWLFSWGIRSKLRPGQWASIGGNCPIAVRKSDGAMYVLGARDKLEKFAEDMQTGELDRRGRRVG